MKSISVNICHVWYTKYLIARYHSLLINLLVERALFVFCILHISFIVSFIVLVLPFWYLLTRVDPDIFQTSSKTVVCVCVFIVRSGYTGTHTTVLLLFWNMFGTTRVSRYQKGKTRQLVSLFTSKDVLLIVRERLYSSCVQSSMLHGSETWPNGQMGVWC